MKTYSVKHVPLKNGVYSSTTTIPDDLMIPIEVVTPYKYESDNGGGYRWSYTRYGFYIDMEVFSQYQTFFVNTWNEVCFINIKNSDFVKSYRIDDYKYNLSSLDWTMVIVMRDKHDRYQLSETKNRVFLAVPERSFTKAVTKLFLTKEDMMEYQNKANEKRKKKNDAEKQLMDNTNNGELSFSTPRKVVASINKPTDHVKGLNVGDTIYGVIKCLNDKGKSVLNVSSSYVNYIDIYVNDIRVNTVPMSIFGDIMEKYFVLKD